MPGSSDPKKANPEARVERLAKGFQRAAAPTPEALRGLQKFDGLLGRVRAFSMMMRDPEYKLPWRLRIMIPLTIVYVLWPLDFLPWVVFLLFGLVDDLALLGVTLFLINGEIERYLAKKKATNDAEIVDGEFEEIQPKAQSSGTAPRRP